MGRRMIGAAMLAAAILAVSPAARAADTAQLQPVGMVVSVSGVVEVGSNGQWQPAAEKLPLYDGQSLRTGTRSAVEVLFGADVPARLGEQAEIAVADLLLKARLERTREKIAVPGDTQKVEMQVTPVTGVRGTEKGEEKAGELKREHYWNENAAPAKE